MKNVEQEYNLKVTSIKPFIKYCISNGYDLVEKSDQKRIIYKKPDKTMLRVTITKVGDNTRKELDFKQDNLSDESYVERKESLPITFEDDKAVKSIIEFLGYKKAIELKRIRYVFVKKNIKLELDEYKSPEQMQVVAIEGKEEKITKVFNELKETYNKYILK